ncbi:L,D-transpeptidase family protein [Aquella oligotrophica]|uniref:L,D-TPase catalytic domain-containing protein n=1 Tax=Aquella oligotrophica TaxID=2067065 RepID=A0A2I7N5H8_9NEIS|nr:L,D-transpeptidase family protein [Aquella oligotrophica]AUR51465.1 hypothetical protein CUN60_03890 [Aquella oligotrophica]
MIYIRLIFCILSIFAMGNSYADQPSVCNDIYQNREISAKTKQLLIVKKSESKFYLYACSWKDNAWHESLNLRTKVAIGKNGLAKEGTKVEGDLKTPAGVFLLGTGFGIKPQNVNFPYRVLTDQDKFIDDADNDDYNSWVSGETTSKSYEPMKRYYKYGIVIEYNMNPIIKGKGSAIFVHNWNYPDEPTSGCIAMPEQKLLKIIRWLQVEKNPSIFIEE